MRFHRLPRGIPPSEFWLPPLPGRDQEDEPEPDGKHHAKRDTRTGRFTRLSKRERQKARARKRAKETLARGQAVPGKLTCYSATCVECGKVWISAVRPIKGNAVRDGRTVYVCHNCR